MEYSPIILAHEPIFSIGRAEVHPATRELRLDGKSTILEPRVMQVLVALYRADGAVVSKDDLVAACWNGRVVGDDAINRVIGRLRHNAEHDAQAAFRIETITRVGYRLVENGTAVRPESSIDRRGLMIGGAVVVAAAGAGLLGWGGFTRPHLTGEAKSLMDQAHAAFLEGTADQNSNAVAKLRAASQLAPNSAEVWGALAWAYKAQLQQIPPEQRQLTIARADAAAARALAIDPDNGDALAARVWGKPIFGNWLSIERDAREALKRAPDHWGLNKTLGFVLTQVGRLRDAMPYFDQAMRAEPMAVYSHMFRIGTLWDLGRLDEAEQAIDTAFRLWPRHFGIWFSRYYFLLFNGRPQEALAMIQDVSSRPVGIPVWNLEMTGMEAEAILSGDPAKIDATVTKMGESARIGTGFAENAAIFDGFVGRFDEAFAVLDGYYFDRGFSIGGQRWSKEQGYYSARGDRHTYFLFHRQLDRLRRDPRFARLTREAGLDDYWRKTGSRPDYLA